MTSLIQRFVDLATGEVTADVNNSKTTTDDLSVAGQNGLQNPQEVSSSRSFDTWETNNTGNPLWVTVTILLGAGDLSADDQLRVIAHANSTQTNNPQDRETRQTSDGSLIELSVQMLVPDGWEYRVQLVIDDSGAASPTEWQESRLGI